MNGKIFTTPLTLHAVYKPLCAVGRFKSSLDFFPSFQLFVIFSLIVICNIIYFSSKQSYSDGRIFKTHESQIRRRWKLRQRGKIHFLSRSLYFVQVISKHPDLELAQLRFLVNHPEIANDKKEAAKTKLQEVFLYLLFKVLLFVFARL